MMMMMDHELEPKWKKSSKPNQYIISPWSARVIVSDVFHKVPLASSFRLNLME